jgi:hypothetical protein
MPNILTIVTPVYDDWDCLQNLTSDVSRALQGQFDGVCLVVVNDCSSAQPDKFSNELNGVELTRIDLVTNVGHQRAILVGLCYCLEHGFDSEYFIIMDSDGEDNPVYITDLIDKCASMDNQRVIFARRSKRSESSLFRFFYSLYKLSFKLLTGYSISYGNFSCVPKSMLARICNEPNFWNHYSASMRKSKVPFDTIPTSRSKRYFGTSKMNINSLIIHGLSSLSVYIEEIIIRALKLSFLVVILLLTAGIVVLYIKYFTTRAIPGWTTSVFGFLVNTLVTVVLFNLLLILSHLNTRNKHLSRPISFYDELISNHKDHKRN